MPKVFENKDEMDRQGVDFIITLGGDGTILWASKQFYQDYVPPLISFAHGSLGYLCSYTEDDFESILDGVLADDANIVTDDRMRLAVSIPNNPVRDIYKGNDLTPSK